jgi:hypothetical protein
MLGDEINRFNSFDLNQVFHTGSSLNFNDKRQSVDEIYEMLREITDIIITPSIPVHDWLAIPLEEYLLHFNNLLNQLSIYNANSDNPQQQLYQGLKVSIDDMYKQFFGMVDLSNPKYPSLKNYNFLAIYNFVKQKVLPAIDSTRDTAQKRLKEIDDIKQKAADLHVEMQRQSTETVSEKYANIFGREALIHSNSDSAKGKRGDAQTWLLAAVWAIVVFIIFIYFIDGIMPIDKKETNSTVIVIEYLRRLLLVSFFLYVITFMFRQYSIHKHLATVNKHRENTLNSFKLFIQSIDSSDSDVKNTIVKEIAKAIYESGETGYISLKQGASDSSSIVTEITKYIKPN